MNLLNMTACALGNHEFDDSPEGLLPLAQQATFPIVCSNCDFTEMPEFHNLVKPYIVVEVEGRKIGVIGYLTPNTRVRSDYYAEPHSGSCEFKKKWPYIFFLV